MSDDDPNTEPGGAAPGEEPLYNIGVVARMTGVPVATLRVWERRYGFPETARSEGGHRIYSDDDVARLRWVKARVDEGMQVGRAVKALAVAESQGRYPARSAAQDRPAFPQPGDPSLAAFQRRLTASLLRHDTEAADQLLGEVLAVYSLEDLILGVLRPMLAEMGEGWAAGEVSVATEHLATQFVRQRLLVWLAGGPAARPMRPLVLACAPDEWHDASLLMLGVLLRRRRWPIAYLGQAVPLPDLADFVERVDPSAVVLVAMRRDPATALLAWPEWMPDVARDGRPPVLYGGLGFGGDPDLRGRMAGHYLGDTVPDGIATIERQLQAGGA